MCVCDNPSRWRRQERSCAASGPRKIRSSSTSPARSAANCATAMRAPGKPLLGFVGEEEQPDVPGRFVLVDGGGDTHSAVDGSRVAFVAECAADIMQMLPHDAFSKKFDPYPMRGAVVPRHSHGLFQQGIQSATGFRVHGLRADSNPVLPVPAGARPIRSTMRTLFAGGCPDDQNVVAVQDLGRQDRGVARPHGCAAPPDPSLRCIDLLTGQSDRRPNGPALRLGDSDDDITAVEVLEIVGECTDRLQHLKAGGVAIPARLEFDAHGFYRASAEEIVGIDRQDGAHAEIVAVARRTIKWTDTREHGHPGRVPVRHPGTPAALKHGCVAPSVRFR